jgi:protein-disulfide isomerase
MKYGERVALSYIHFPINGHRFAIPAARAAECADAEHKFGALHDVLFDKQDSLGLKSWNSYAQEAGIRDIPGFERCVTTLTDLVRVNRGRSLGGAMNVHGTPDVMVNGWRFASPPTPNELMDAVDSVLKHKPVQLASNAPVDTVTVKLP